MWLHMEEVRRPTLLVARRPACIVSRDGPEWPSPPSSGTLWDVSCVASGSANPRLHSRHTVIRLVIVWRPRSAAPPGLAECVRASRVLRGGGPGWGTVRLRNLLWRTSRELCHCFSWKQHSVVERIENVVSCALIPVDWLHTLSSLSNSIGLSVF